MTSPGQSLAPCRSRLAQGRATPWLLLAVGGALALAVAAGLAWAWGAPAASGAGWLAHRRALLDLQASHPWGLGLGLFAGMALLSALALPGNAPLALAAGLCFGTWVGTALVVLASTVGATVSFLAARHWLRHRLARRWGGQLAQVQAAVARDGAFYLFSLRVMPVIPYPVINPLMGLTAMPVVQFFVVSLLGMLAGSAAYAFAGNALATAQAVPDLLSPGLWGGLAALALLPWALRWLLQRLHRPRR